MRVLIACEFSGIVRDAFRWRGDDAISCDLVRSLRPGPHIIGDVRGVLCDGWDLLIAFPPCRFLTRAGSRYWKDDAWAAGQDRAGQFCRSLWEAPIGRICIENPPGALPHYLGRFNQTFQPWQFGHPFTKLTCLWLKRLPPLMESARSRGRRSWVQANNPHSKQRTRRRSLTFPGVASAMAAQWGSRLPHPPARSGRSPVIG